MVNIDETTEGLIKEKFGDKILETKTDSFHRLYVVIDKDIVNQFAEYVSKELGYVHTNYCQGTDLDDKIEVSWVVGNPEYRTLLVIRVHLDRENPVVNSLTYLWNGMDWHERETYEMLGVIFENHSDLRRLILPDDWDGFPLRNDYVYNKPMYRKPEDELEVNKNV